MSFRNQYLSKKFSSIIRDIDLPMEKNARGFLTTTGVFSLCVKLVVPLVYVYIVLIFVRELTYSFPDTINHGILAYLPQSFLFVEIWIVIEALFYVYLKLRIRQLQCKDPLEASLSAAPMLELHEREKLWQNMMECIMVDDPIAYITGWFFDQDIETLSRYDILDFTTWAMFEGRNQEHLTGEEVNQLKLFVKDLEWVCSIFLYGEVSKNGSLENSPNRERALIGDFDGTVSGSNSNERKIGIDCQSEEKNIRRHICTSPVFNKKQTLSKIKEGLAYVKRNDDFRKRAKSSKNFHFKVSSDDDHSNLFTNLFESYKMRYDQYRHVLENVQADSVEGFRKYMTKTMQQIHDAEEHAIAAASRIYNKTYFAFVDKGSEFDKLLMTLSSATHNQLTEVWNTVWNMKERLETAKFLSSKRKVLQQQLQGYRMALKRMREMSTSIPTEQMADLLKKITQCNEKLDSIENLALNAFMKLSGSMAPMKHMFTKQLKAQRYAKYSYDPLLGLSTCPLIIYMLILGVTDGGLRIMMRRRGFKRLTIHSISYYYHPGISEPSLENPFVFCHGIGIGLLTYMPLIDQLMTYGRPILLPEIPYVSGFRPWQCHNSILTPAAASNILTALLASHGFMKGTFIGHSYGTSWLSYLCKYGADAIGAILFLDPICFCLHYPCLTKSFVYHRTDPGSISYLIKTDVIVNWTIQRSFPWARIVLFTEDIPDVPCSIFLSDKDTLAPANRIEKYLRSKNVSVKDFDIDMDLDYFSKGSMNVTVFRGDGHGDWTMKPSMMKTIANAANKLAVRPEKDCQNIK